MAKKSKSSSSSIVKSEDVVEEVPAPLETVEEVPDDQESSNPRNSKKSHKKHKKSKKSHRHKSSKHDDELQQQDDLIEELEQQIQEIKKDKKKKKGGSKKIKQEDIQEAQAISSGEDMVPEEVVRGKQVETPQKPHDIVEISEETVQETKVKNKVKKEKTAKVAAVKKQEDELNDIAQEKVEKFNQHQREAYNAYQKKWQQKQLNKKRKYVQRGGNNDEEHQLVNDLINRMKEAWEMDKISNKKKQPAIRRLMMSQEVFKEVKKINFQDKFLESGGCQVFADWINQMPDGTFPNINLVEGVLNCVDTLRVDIQHLEECEIAKVIQCYAENLAGIPSLQGLAKRIIEKWSRLIYGIKSHYADGLDDYEEGYKNLQKRLDKIRGNHVNSDLDDEDDEQEDEIKRSQKKKNNLQSPMSEHILTASSFARKNAFDFVERPDPIDRSYCEKKRDPNSGRARLEKILEKLRRENLPKQNVH